MYYVKRQAQKKKYCFTFDKFLKICFEIIMKSLQIPEIVHQLLCNIYQTSASDNHLHNYRAVSRAKTFYISTVKEEKFSSSHEG